jgi:hypothetical protein
VRLAGGNAQRDLLLEAVDQVVRGEAAVELRVREVAVGLRDQMLQLLRQQAADLQTDAGQVAHEDRQLALARECEQGALAHDGELGREGLQQRHALPCGTQLVAAGRLQALGDAHQQVAPALGLRHAKADHVAHFALAGDGLQVELLRAAQHRIGDLRGVGRPVELVVAVVLVALGFFGGGQQPGLHPARHFALVHGHGGGDVHHVLGLAVLAGDDGGLHAGHGQAEEAGNVDGARGVAALRGAALLRDAAGREAQHHGARLLGNGQRLGLHRGVQAQLVVADGELFARALAHAEERGTASLVVGEHQALLEFRGVHGVREAHLEQGAAHVGLHRVLIELGGGDLRGELGRGELVLAQFQLDVRGERAAGKLHLVRLADGPVLRGQELEPVLPGPGPAPGNGRLDADAGRLLADARNGRHGGREVDDEGVGPLVEFDLRALRRLGLRGGDDGLHAIGREPVPPLHQMRAGHPPGEHQQQEQYQPGQPLLQPLQAEQQKRARDAQPARGSPETDDPTGHRTQEAEHAAQSGEKHVAERR